MMGTAATREQFTTKWGFVFAAIGGAVGLGNIWRFPFIAGENGGGAFVLLYFLFTVSFGVPAVIAMIVIGRRGGQSPVGSTRTLALVEGRSANWKYLGWITLVVSYLALTFFSVIAGWVLVYLLKSASGLFAGITPAESKQIFADVKGSVRGMMFWHGVFMAFTILVVVGGVRAGVEKAVRFMVPALFVILLILVGYAAVTAEFARAARFMFLPDLSKINQSVVLLALGQAFFSLSVGGGGMIAYGAYLTKTASIPRIALVVASANVTVDMLAGLAIFPIVFACGLEAAAGPGLIFETLPIAFGQMPGGRVIGTLFFVLVFFAALTTSISMMESVVSRLIERKGASRPMMAALAGGLAWVIGLGSVFSFNIWSDVKPLSFIGLLRDATIFRIVDFVTVNVLVMISAFLITVFVGWVMSKQATSEELAIGDGAVYRAWRFVMRYLAPIAIAVIFVINFLN
jgi:NSS family neurotransmitter:Na+ symporter